MINLFIKLNTSGISDFCNKIILVTPQLILIILVVFSLKFTIKKDIRGVIGLLICCGIMIYFVSAPNQLLELGKFFAENSIEGLKSLEEK